MTNIDREMTTHGREVTNIGREVHIAVSTALCVKSNLGSIQQTLSIQAIRDDRVPTLSIQAISTELEFCRPGHREIEIPEFGAKYTTGRFADNHKLFCSSGKDTACPMYGKAP